MSDLLTTLKSSYLLVPISILLGSLIVFVDSKVNKKSYTKQEYIKISLLLFVISSFIVYIYNNTPNLGEEIITGNPPF